MQNLTAQELHDKLYQIRFLLIGGHLTYDQAKAAAQPFIDEINTRAKTVAKKYGKKHIDFTFAAFMR